MRKCNVWDEVTGDELISPDFAEKYLSEIIKNFSD